MEILNDTCMRDGKIHSITRDKLFAFGTHDDEEPWDLARRLELEKFAGLLAAINCKLETRAMDVIAYAGR